MRISSAPILCGLVLLFACSTSTERSSTITEPQRPDEKDLVEAVQRNPEDPEAHMRLGFYYWRCERQLNKARRHYELAIEYQGRREYTGPHYVLGCILLELKEYEKALVEWEDCVRVPPENQAILLLDKYYHMSHYQSALVYAKQKKDPETAKEHLKRFLDLGGAEDLEKDIHGALATVYARDKKDPDSARAHLDKFKELGGDETEAKRIQRALDRLQASEPAGAKEETGT